MELSHNEVALSHDENDNDHSNHTGDGDFGDVLNWDIPKSSIYRLTFHYEIDFQL